MKIPGKATISNRSSTISSQFARARAPYFKPSGDDLLARYILFAIDPSSPSCAYCGAGQTEWDHLFPMVEQSRWTGYFTELSNLIPACGKCNQSRGSKPFAAWMRGGAPQSPLRVFQARDGMTPEQAQAEVERRIAVIEEAISCQPPRRLLYEVDQLEDELEQCRLELLALLMRSEEIAARLRNRYQALAQKVDSASAPAPDSG